ncbi:MAG: hypothetical protein LBF67_07670 [Prevotellaceae bacterium]|jgi:hypothetical protein|nr:hypothetical protein [Prevotellaceae bacterium]
MKKGTKNRTETHDAAHTAGHKNYSQTIYTGEPVPLDLMEKPNGARAKQWKNTGMPSDFWL